MGYCRTLILTICTVERAHVICIFLMSLFNVTKQAKAFELSYLEKVPEVKDTVHKQSLLHHVCTMVVENFPDSSDLYSEIGAITRSAKVRPWPRRRWPRGPHCWVFCVISEAYSLCSQAIWCSLCCLLWSSQL